MLIVKPRMHSDKPNYERLCQHTVTLYNVYENPDKSAGYHKTVFYNSAYLEGKRSYPVNATGMMANTNGLLVIPINESNGKFVYPNEYKELSDKSGYWTIQKSDKVMPGIGPEIVNESEWVNMKDSNYPGCISIEGIEFHSALNGELVHIQATPK